MRAHALPSSARVLLPLMLFIALPTRISIHYLLQSTRLPVPTLTLHQGEDVPEPDTVDEPTDTKMKDVEPAADKEADKEEEKAAEEAVAA